ncbi:MAG: ribonuclease P protein component [Bacteroidales bacterium]|nr:ribonuclease P protein component [Bacteroidales bacterium]
MKNTFHRKERLGRRNLIKQLFDEGSTFHKAPFRVTWMFHTLASPTPVQVLIPVSKRIFPKPVHRNLIRRRIREAFRQNKHPLYESLQTQHRQFLISIHYTAKEILPYKTVQEIIILILQRLREENEKVTK